MPSSAAIKESYVDFRDNSEYAKASWENIKGLKELSYWDGTRLHFLTETIHPKIKASTRPRVMLLFSNPHPESVKKGLFIS